MKEFLRAFTLTGWLMIAVLTVLVISLSYCAYDAARDRRDAEALDLRNSQVQQTDTGARENAADEPRSRLPAAAPPGPWCARCSRLPQI